MTPFFLLSVFPTERKHVSDQVSTGLQGRHPTSVAALAGQEILGVGLGNPNEPPNVMDPEEGAGLDQPANGRVDTSNRSAILAIVRSSVAGLLRYEGSWDPA